MTNQKVGLLRLTALAASLLLWAHGTAVAAVAPIELTPVQDDSVSFGAELQAACAHIQTIGIALGVDGGDGWKRLARVPERGLTIDVSGARIAEVDGVAKPAVKLDQAALADIAGLCGAIRNGDELTDEQTKTLDTLYAHPRLIGEWLTGLVDLPARKIMRPMWVALPVSESNARGLNAGTPGAGAAGLEEVIVRGLVDFVVRRAKSEGQLYLQRQVRDELCTESMRPFFPHLCVAFDELEGQATLVSMSRYIKAAAEQDILYAPEGLLLRWAEVKRAEDAKATTLQKMQDAFAFLQVGMAFVRGVERGDPIIPLVNGISELEKIECLSADPNGGVATDCRAIRALRVMALVFRAAFVEVSKAEAGKKLDPKFAAFATAYRARKLVEEAVGENEYAGGWDVTKINRITSELVGVVARVEAVVLRVKALEAAIEDLKASRATDSTALRQEVLRNAAQVVSSSLVALGGMTKAVEVASGVQGDSAQTLDRADKWLAKGSSISLHALELTNAATNRNWAAAAVSGVAIARTTAEIMFEDSQIQFPEKFQRFIPLVAEIADAKSSDEVVNSLDVWADPVGGYAGKYERPMFSIGALFGVSGGGEWIEQGGKSNTGTSAGLFAPIGIQYTRPTGPWWGGRWYWGGFASVFDVGNLASYQFDGSASDSEAPEYGFKQIVAPGAFFTLGIAESPVVVGAGASFSHGLRQVDGKDASSIRAAAFLAMDLTFFRF